jgi:hypothetical protein
MRSVSGKFVEKIETHIMCSVTFFFENRAVYEIILTNVVERGTPQIILTNIVERGTPQIILTNVVERGTPQIILTNVVERGTPQIINWRKRLSCRMPMATNTHTQAV